MKYPIHRKSEGSTLLELLVVLMISTVVSICGFQAINHLLQAHRLSQTRSSNLRKYQSMVDALQVSFDRRYINPFTEEPWLSIQTGPGNQWHPLIMLEIQIIENDTINRWNWEAPGQERIDVSLAGREFLRGEQPENLCIRFPESSEMKFQDGIAIEGF